MKFTSNKELEDEKRKQYAPSELPAEWEAVVQLQRAVVTLEMILSWLTILVFIVGAFGAFIFVYIASR